MSLPNILLIKVFAMFLELLGLPTLIYSMQFITILNSTWFAFTMNKHV